MERAGDVKDLDVCSAGRPGAVPFGRGPLDNPKSRRYFFRVAHVERPGPHLTAARLQKVRQAMATGTVKWFNDAKGFGFIQQDNGGPDVFCHHTAINMQGFRTLQEGQKVEFEVKQGPKGLQAENVRAAGT